MKQKTEFHFLRIFIPISILVFCTFAAILTGFSLQGKFVSDNHLVLLAERFLNHDLALLPTKLPSGDYVDFYAKQYLYFGPFPSMVFIPFVFIWGLNVPQVLLGIFSSILIFWACMKIASYFKFDISDQIWLGLASVFANVAYLLSITNITAWQVQIFGVALVSLALVEFYGQKRYWLIGLFIACAGMTRFTLYASVIFFLWEISREKNKIRTMAILLLPIIMSLVCLGIYNYKRFRSFIETGYQYNVALKQYPMAQNAAHGFANITHIPANVYAYVLMGPEIITKEGGGFILKYPFIRINPWGLSFILTSPYMIFLLANFKKSAYTFAALATIFFLIIPAMMYFGIGYIQSGYRYALDWFLFSYLLLLPSLGKPLKRRHKVAITAGIIFNIFYGPSIFGIYPLLGIR